MEDLCHHLLTDQVSPLSETRKKMLNVGSEDVKSVLKHHNLTTGEVQDMINSVKDWLTKQPHLPGDKLKDQQIFGHLMFRGFNVEKLKSNLDDYFRAPHKTPDVMTQRDPLSPVLAEHLERRYWLTMPKKTPEHYRVTFFRMLPSTKTTKITEIIKVSFLITEYRMWNEASLGECWILDLENASFKDSLQLTPVLLSHIVFLVLACFGARLKSVHVMNVPSFGVHFMNFFKNIMKAKISARLKLITKEELVTIFPKECIPNDYGGEGGNYDDLAGEWQKVLQTDVWRQYFIELDDLRSDESLRLGPLPENETFGADGSFRKICID